MKKFLFALVAGIPALVVSTGAYAQDPNNLARVDPAKDFFKMNKMYFSPEKTNSVDLDINSKAVKNFKKVYENVSNEKWYKAEDGFRAGFVSNGINTTVFYNKKGQWVGSLKAYNEDQMDRAVRTIVKQQYFDYKITYVEEVETNNTNGIPTYIIHLEDANHIKLVRVRDGEMDMYKEFVK